jgi:hypothetical protein
MLLRKDAPEHEKLWGSKLVLETTINVKTALPNNLWRGERYEEKTLVSFAYLCNCVFNASSL